MTGQFFAPANLGKPDPECTNIVLAQIIDEDGRLDPSIEWVPAQDRPGLTPLYVQKGVRYFGRL